MKEKGKKIYDQTRKGKEKEMKLEEKRKEREKREKT